PGIAKRGNAYLARKGLKAYDNKGKLVTNASVITASNMNRYHFRQDPGPGNALGRVKFNMPNRWDIYLHDTPHRSDFKNTNRALSSGCVRVQNPLELAEMILTQMDHQAKYTPERIDSIVSTRKTLQQNVT